MKRKFKKLFALLMTLIMSVALVSALKTPVKAIEYINSVSVYGMTVPTLNGKPNFTVRIPAGANYHLATYAELMEGTYWNDEAARKYVNGVAWMNSDHDPLTSTDRFTAGKGYYMKIALIPNNGYEFSTSLKVTVNGESSLCGQIRKTDPAWVIDTILFPDPASIREVDVSNIFLPEEGKRPFFAGSVPEGANYHFAQTEELVAAGYSLQEALKYYDGFRWVNADGTPELTRTDTFKDGESYYCEIALIPNDGYFFYETNILSETHYSINGSEADCWFFKKNNKGVFIMRSVAWLVGEIENIPIKSVSVTNVPTPEAGKPCTTDGVIVTTDPASSVQVIDMYWWDNQTGDVPTVFEEDHAYIFSVELEPNPYHKFIFNEDGTSRCSVTFNDKKAARKERHYYNDNSLFACTDYMYILPSTPVQRVNTVNITNVPTPAVGRSCSTKDIKITTDPQMGTDTKELYWYDNTSGEITGAGDVFIDGHEYSLYALLGTKSGYEFDFCWDALNGDYSYTGEVTINGKAPERAEKYEWYVADLQIISKSVKPVVPGTWESSNGKWYYKVDGKVQTGWFLDVDTWYYADSKGVMQTGWLKSGNAWYYLMPSGAMATGWLNTGGTWYYMDPSSGAMHTGWVLDGDTWYFMYGSGAMATGWIKLGNTWYYMNSSGAMATGWVLSDGNWYYMSSSGAMVTGWVNDHGKWYYMYGSGAMASNTWVGNYYLQADGSMATDMWIGQWYVGSDGAWVPEKKH